MRKTKTISVMGEGPALSIRRRRKKEVAFKEADFNELDWTGLGAGMGRVLTRLPIFLLWLINFHVYGLSAQQKSRKRPISHVYISSGHQS